MQGGKERMNPQQERSLRPPRASRLAACFALCAAALLWGPTRAYAQVDPLLFLQRNKPNIIIAVDVANRMQRDSNGAYYDAYNYPRTGAIWEELIGVSSGSSSSLYRRYYPGLAHTDASLFGDRYAATAVWGIGDRLTGYSSFWARTRLGVARAGLLAAVQSNTSVARFGVIKMRQSNPRVPFMLNEGPVFVTEATQQGPTETGSTVGRWKISWPIVDSVNGAITTPASPLVAADATGANASVATLLAKTVDQSGALLPAGRDSRIDEDAPLSNLLADARAEATRLIAADTQCRNTVVVLIAGGGEGTTVSGADPAARAATFLSVSGHRVPIYVIAVVPPASSVAMLRAIAVNSGGGYYEITKAMIDAVPAGTTVPEVVRGVNAAIQHAFAAQTDVDTAPTAALPRGPQTEWQTASPIVGTVNLENGVDITGATLVNTQIVTPGGTVVPQRSNVMVTTGTSLPGFEGRLRGIRTYVPRADATQPYGWAFVAASTRLWVSSLPAASQRNIFTTLPTGGMLALTSANASALAPYLNTTDAAALIEFVRAQSLGAILDSTPAILDPPSLDPPPDADYPAFATALQNRRSLIFVGANDGMLHAIDARTGVEAWAYVPFNLLPKLKALLNGEAVGAFTYFADSSPKIADVKVGGAWHTYLLFGQGPGGTFYQALDVTLTDMVSAVSPDADNRSALLAFFTDPGRITLAWSFPARTSFDATLSPYGDVSAGASAIEKSVGETWSDPVVGQVTGASSDWVALAGSGFLSRTIESRANRAGTAAGTTFYLINIADGAILDSRVVGNDGAAETVDNCAAAGDCRRMKNALQSDPVATGPSESRYISKAYIGDLDGRAWRFNLTLNTSGSPRFSGSAIKLFDAGNTQPIFASMASVNVGGSLDYLFFATGSDMLPSTGVSQSYKLFGVLDSNGTGVQKFAISLASVDGSGVDEKASGFPAVAGDIVFFTTTSFTPTAPCSDPTSNLYAMTFLGGAAYDTNASGNVTNKDTVLVRSGVLGRATAPFVVDRHLIFTAGNKVEIIGDPADYNNGFGQVGVRVLSWRVRQ
jgi:hypothetical protein